VGWKRQAFDYGAASATLCIGPFIRELAQRRSTMPVTRGILDRFGVSCISHHYYEPIVLPQEITHDLTAERSLPGLDMNADEQLAILRAFNYAAEISEIEARPHLILATLSSNSRLAQAMRSTSIRWFATTSQRKSSRSVAGIQLG
jgi:hypothetical protein